jgi:lysozyme family protein
MNFDEAFDVLIGHEGGYANDSRDPGGETMWGVTARVARKDGYLADMHDLPRARAKAIYKAKYWDAVMADKLPEKVRYVIFDTAVNSGPTKAIELLQRVLDVGEDGVLGPLTFDALNRANGLLTAVAYIAERLDFLTNLPTWAAFGKGWTRRNISILKGLA